MFWSTRAFTRELDSLFGELRDQSALLHQIDQLILNPNEAIDAKLRTASVRFAEILRARGWAIIFPHGADFRALFGKDQYLWDRRERFLESIQTKIAETRAAHLADAGTAKRAMLPKLIDIILSDDDDGLATVLVVPVEAGAAEPFCYLAFVIVGLPRALTGLETEDVREFAIQVATQLSILVQRTQEALIARFQLILNTIYFESETGSRDALSIAMDSAADLLPNWEPFYLAERPIVQLLLYRGNDRPLRMLAAGGGKQIQANGDAIWESAIGKLVAIDKSVCGYYLQNEFPKQEKKGAWVTNPKRDHSTLFKLFQGSVVPESEMVVPLLRNKAIIGVLNFEHERPNVFTRYHQEMAEAMSSVIVPFLNQTHQLEKRIKEKEIALLATITKQISRIKKQAQHKTHGNLLAIERDVDRLKRRHNDEADTHKVLDRIYSGCEKLDTYMSSYIQEIPDYLQSGAVDLKLAIRKAIGYFEPKHQAPSNGKDTYRVEEDEGSSSDIEVSWPDGDGPVHVFASQQIQDHLYSFLKNSLEAIAERRSAARNDTPGLITVKVALHPMTDDLNQAIPGHRVAVTILDNGAGAPTEKLPEIFQGNSTKDGGWGFGLRAARDYIRKFGGDVEGSNRADGPGFQVILFLDEYDPQRHSETDIVGY